MVAGQTGDLERSLLDSMEGDQRLASGAQVAPADNVLDFVQMTGLAAQRRARSAGTLHSPPLRDSVLDPLVFFEEGVGDVDVSMDPGTPILPELDSRPFENFEPALRDEPEINSITGLQEIIAELRQRDHPVAAPEIGPSVFDAQEAEFFTPDMPIQRKPIDAEIRASFAEIADLLNEEPPAVDDTSDSDREIVYELDRAEIESRQSLETQEEEPPPSPNDLGEAKALLKELELIDKPETLTPPDVAPKVSLVPAPSPRARQASPKPSSSHRRPRNKRRRRLGRWMLRAAMVLALIGVAAGVVQFFIYQAETPAAAYRSAGRMLDSGKYAEASSAYQAFARRFPSEIEASDAMFLAGYAMQLTPEPPRGDSRLAHANALDLLGHFILEYPSHPKVARAETLTGVLHFRMGNHAEAIGLLRDPDRRLRDPGAYLTTLRTLGRSYAALSQIDNAHASFMRAAALEGNYSADEDYVELGSMYQKLSERSVSQEAKRGYWEQAMEQWDYALRVPGLLKSRRDDIRLMRDLVSSKLEFSGFPLGGDEDLSAGP